MTFRVIDYHFWENPDEVEPVLQTADSGEALRALARTYYSYPRPRTSGVEIRVSGSQEVYGPGDVRSFGHKFAVAPEIIEEVEARFERGWE